MNTSLSQWNPFNELNDLQSRLSSILSGTGAAESGAEGHTNLMNADWQPAVDISEDDKEYLVTADLPEVRKDEVQIGVENGVLTITGERKSSVEEKDEKRKFHRVERRYGRYVRQLPPSRGCRRRQDCRRFRQRRPARPPAEGGASCEPQDQGRLDSHHLGFNSRFGSGRGKGTARRRGSPCGRQGMGAHCGAVSA